MSIDRITALKRADLFGNLSEDLLSKIAGLAISHQLQRGQVLYSEDEEAAGLYVIAAGEMRSVRQNVQGQQQVLSTERAGAVLAAVPVFNGGKFYSTMLADSISEILFIDKRSVHQLCREHTEILWNLARVLGHKTRHYAELIEMLALRSVDERVAQYLLTVAQERGIPVGEGYLVELTLTRREIAMRLGTVREAVSRGLSHLQDADLVHIQGKRLVDIPSLRALSTFIGIDRKAEETKVIPDLSSEMA